MLPASPAGLPRPQQAVHHRGAAISAMPARLGVLDLDHATVGLEAQVSRLALTHHGTGTELLIAIKGNPNNLAAAAAEQRVCAQSVRAAPSGSGVEEGGGMTARLALLLGRVFDRLSEVSPRLHAVPLLPWAGWSIARLASLPEVTELVLPPFPQLEASSSPPGPAAAPTSPSAPHVAETWQAAGSDERVLLLEQALGGPVWVTAPRPSGGVDVLLASTGSRKPSPAAAAAAAAGGGECAPEGGAFGAGEEGVGLVPSGSGSDPRSIAGQPGVPSVDLDPALSPLDSTLIRFEGGAATSRAPGLVRFDDVAMGGTFDRLHSGHMLLLAMAGLVTAKKLYVGITADALLVNKAHFGLLQPYDERERAAVRYLQQLRPDLDVQTGALRDPKEPTAAELDQAMQAIVVSEETVSGAQRINEGRIQRGYKPLQVVVVPLMGLHRRDGMPKLSSSDLRAADAASG